MVTISSTVTVPPPSQSPTQDAPGVPDGVGVTPGVGVAVGRGAWVTGVPALCAAALVPFTPRVRPGRGLPDLPV